MDISIFGLGYVGAVSAGCLANEGHKIIGVDPFQAKVDLVNQGKTPVIEKDIGEIIDKAVADGLLQATQDVQNAVQGTQLSQICVGTPSRTNGSLDLKYVEKVCEEIGTALKSKDTFHVVVARSTMLPGSMRETVIPILEKFSGKKAGTDFGVCNNPEFLREGTAVHDFYNPPKTVIGEVDTFSGDLLAELYSGLEAPLIRTSLETAELVKYADNAWHALKVTFANEIGNISKSLGMDGHAVMDIFCQDTKLNLSPHYLKPGFAFGGACLPKDVRALTYKAKSIDVTTPILDAIIPSNNLQVQKALQMIVDKGNRKVGVLGFSFKAGTDDLRESPMVEVIESLLGKGYDIRIYDSNVNIASLVGANKDYILNQIPHVSRMMVSTIDDVLQHAETIVIGNSSSEFESVLERINESQTVIDLVRLSDETSGGSYDGICW